MEYKTSFIKKVLCNSWQHKLKKALPLPWDMWEHYGCIPELHVYTSGKDTHKLQVFIDTLPHNMPTFFSLISLRGKEEKEILLHFSTNLQTLIKTGHAPLKQVIWDKEVNGIKKSQTFDSKKNHAGSKTYLFSKKTWSKARSI